MYVYDVMVVDTKECKVLHQQQVIAEDQGAAMLELDIDAETKARKRDGRVAILFNEVGGFDRYRPKVRMVDAE